MEETLLQPQIDVTPEKQAETTQNIPEKQPEKPAEMNWRLARERLEAAERRALEAERRLQEMSAPREEEEEERIVTDDALPEGKDLNRAYSKLSKQNKKTKQELDQFYTALAEMKLRSKFSDFDAVVTPENIEKLKAQKMSLARSIASTPDLYDRGEVAYEAIKTWIIKDEYQEQEKKIKENLAKPKSGQSAGAQAPDTPLARLDNYDRRRLTESDRVRLYQEMQEAKMYR